mmetsp:Transcript_2232/g.3163  ORF Transcript_2232/g.3163 Transcript_2232/m.3163 type:complete len:123 (+) Transcript_2232:333-701(+)
MDSNPEGNMVVGGVEDRYVTRLRRQRGILKPERGGNPTPRGLMMVVGTVTTDRVGFRMKAAGVPDDSDTEMITMIIQGKDTEPVMTTVLGTCKIDTDGVLRSIIDCSLPPRCVGDYVCKCTE